MADHGNPRRRSGTWAICASVISASLASACCWLPLLLLGFGISTAGVSATFEKYRPAFLSITAVLLSAGFYFAYFRRERCETGSACAAPKPKLKRFHRAMLWIATVVVAGTALFPSYAGLLLRQGAVPAVHDSSLKTITLGIDGMTCAACAVHVQKELSAVPGVQLASVDYDKGEATVSAHPTTPVSLDSLKNAIEKAGYRMTLKETQ